jgi:Putative prokaryotic signal transducing protein
MGVAEQFGVEMLIVLRSFPNSLEAHMAKAQLAAEGIEAVLHDEHIVALNWLYSDAMGGIKLLVLAEDVAAARECLNAVGVRATTNEVEPDMICSHCGGQLGPLVKHQSAFALTWLLKGFPLWPIRFSRNCTVCKQTHSVS